MMKTEKADELKKYFENGPDIFGSRMLLNNGSSEKIKAFSNVLKLPENEEIIVFFDDTIRNSGKGGLTFTSWGVRYSYALYKWDLSWEELGEKYTFHREGLIFNKLILHNEQGNIFSRDKEIDLTYASFDIEWLKRILLNGCLIMNGKDPLAASGKVKDKKDTEHQKVILKKDAEDDDSEMKYRVFNYSSPPSLILDSAKIHKFQQHLLKAISGSDSDYIKSHSILWPSEKMALLKAKFNFGPKEELIFLLDLSFEDDEEENDEEEEIDDIGFVMFTDTGIHYKFWDERKKLVPWFELAEKYAIRINHLKGFVDIIKPNNITDKDADPVMRIKLPETTDKWLFDVICKGCEIYAGLQNLNAKGGFI